MIIDGKKVSSLILDEISGEVSAMTAAGQRPPCLAAILVGHDGGSEAYVANKVRTCQRCGFESRLLRFDADVSEAEVLDTVRGLNEDEGIDGFIVQLPLPRHIDEQKIIEAIDPDKDVDGFNPVNVGRVAIGLPGFEPATPAGIVELLKRYGIATRGRHCVILGRSNIVGKPMALLMLRKDAPGDCTVTVCHSATPDVAQYTRQADILIAAMGVPGFVKADMVKENAVVIDVGTTRVKDDSRPGGWRLSGDVDFDAVAPKCSYITPVPGGVGPMTIVMLMRNTLESWKRRVGADSHNRQSNL